MNDWSLKLPAIIKHHVVATVILSAGVVSVAWIFWFIAATKYQGVIDHWIEVGRSQGYEITYDGREQFGFPKRSVLRFINLRWKNPEGITFHADDLDISAGFGESKKFVAKFKGQVEIDTPIQPEHAAIVLGGTNGEAHVSLDDDGLWDECSITMKSARVGRMPDYIFTADDIKLNATRPTDQPDNAKSAGLTLTAEAQNITVPSNLPEVFGYKIPHLQTALRIMGAVPDFRSKDSAAEWNKKNGTVEFDRLDMEWGPLVMTSKGTMGFDDDLQPEGAFAGVIEHPDQVLAMLMKGGFIAATQQEMLGSAMKLFAKPAPIHGESGVEVPVAVQLGGFFLGPVRIFAFPQIEWK